MPIRVEGDRVEGIPMGWLGKHFLGRSFERPGVQVGIPAPAEEVVSIGSVAHREDGVGMCRSDVLANIEGICIEQVNAVITAPYRQFVALGRKIEAAKALSGEV